MDKNQRSTASAPLRRPMLSLPPRSAVETIFTGASTASPGPMTLVSSFFSENDPDSDCRSFSQLLAGDASPESGGGCGSESDLRFKMNRPSGLVVTQPSIFTIPPGLSPASLLDSPGLYSASQQPLAQVTVQASQAHCQPQIQVEYRSSTATPASSFQHLTASISNTSTYQQMQFSSMPKTNLVNESAEFSYSDMRSHPSSCTVDKPADDGYNWRKYGQKQVKGSEYPRSYYKCTQLNCPVKKIVERSLEGQVTEIVYKGQHNHQPPQSSKRGKDTGNSIETTNFQGNSGGQIANSGKMNDGRSVYSLPAKDHELSLGTHDHLSGSSDSDEVDDSETRGNERSKDEPEAKRRNTEVRVVESVSSHRTVTEPRIVVQTTSEVDLLDDGFRWRKYGQKVVKGNPYPRSYYKCTSAGCNVRKHVERAASDPKAVITTYEGKHKHDVPAAKNSSHSTANSLPLHSKPNNVIGDRNALTTRTEFPNYDQQQPVGVLRFKEEQIII